MKHPIFPLFLKRSIMSGNRRVGQPVAIIGQENLLVLQQDA